MKKGIKIIITVLWMMMFTSVISAEEIHTELGSVEEFIEWSLSDISMMSTLNFVRRVGVIGGLDHRSYFSLMEIDGILVYCLDPTIFAGTGKDYQISWDTIDEATKQKLFCITNVGYGYPGHTDDRWFIATQLAVWEVMGFDSYYAMTFENEVLDLSWEIAEIKRLSKTFGGSASFSGQTLELDLNESHTLCDEHGVLSHFQVSDVEGVDIQQNGNEITITIVDRQHQRTLSDAKGVTTGGLVYVYPGMQSLYMVHRSEVPYSYQLNLKLKTRDLQIVKHDPSGEIAQGTFRFEILDEKGRVVMDDLEITEGTLKIDDVLPKGIYWLKEKETSYPYALNEMPLKIELNEQEENQVIFVNEFEPVDVEIIKMDKDTKELLSGAVFEVEFVDNEKRTSYLRTSTNKGKTSFQVPYGKSIRVCEVTAPEGYVLEKDNCQQIDVFPKSKQTLSLEFYNEKKDSVISLKKVDALTKELLEGAVFEIYHKGKKTTVVSEKDEILLSGFKLQDEVKVCEVTPPDGYELSLQSCQTLTLDTEEVHVEFENKKREITLELLKIDGKNRNPLNDSEFEFSRLDDSGQWVSFYRTKTGGQRIYTGKETAGSKVKLYTDEWMRVSLGEFEVDAMGYIHLLDDCAQKTLFAYEQTAIKEYTVMNFEGKIVLPSMLYGEQVQVCETKVPEGYSTGTSACQIVEINSDQNVQQIVIENKLRQIDVRVIKHEHENTSKLLNDAYFTYEIEQAKKSGTAMSGRLVVNGPSSSVFGIYLDESCTKLIKQQKTNENGEWIGICDQEGVYVSFDQGISSTRYCVEEGAIVFEDVFYGDVITVCEVIAPSGYHRQSECQKIEVKSEENQMIVLFANERILTYEEVPTMGIE